MAGISTLCGLEFGYEQPPAEDEAFNRNDPGFFFTSPEAPWDRLDFPGMESTKYCPQCSCLLQGASPHSEASKTRPMTGGSNRCPLSDRFWTDRGALRDAFLDSAYAHLAPPSDEGSGSDTSGEGVFSPSDHLGGSERAVPWSFNQFTPLMRYFGAGMWPRPGNSLYHSQQWPGKGARDLEVLALDLEGFLSGVLLS